MTIIDSNNARCPLCDSRAFVTVSWNDQVDCTRDVELRVTLSCYSEKCTRFSYAQRVTHMQLRQLFPRDE